MADAVLAAGRRVKAIGALPEPVDVRPGLFGLDDALADFGGVPVKARGVVRARRGGWWPWTSWPRTPGRRSASPAGGPGRVHLLELEVARPIGIKCRPVHVVRRAGRSRSGGWSVRPRPNNPGAAGPDDGASPRCVLHKPFCGEQPSNGSNGVAVRQERRQGVTHCRAASGSSFAGLDVGSPPPAGGSRRSLQEPSSRSLIASARWEPDGIWSSWSCRPIIASRPASSQGSVLSSASPRPAAATRSSDGVGPGLRTASTGLRSQPSW